MAIRRNPSLTTVDNLSVQLALTHGLPCIPSVYARTECAGIQSVLFQRIPIQSTEQIVLLGDAFLLVSASLATQHPNLKVRVWEPNEQLYAFGRDWIELNSLPIDLQHRSWTSIKQTLKDTTVLVFWELPFLLSDSHLKNILSSLKDFITRGGRICIRHTSPQYLERHPMNDELLFSPIRGVIRKTACAEFQYMQHLAEELQCTFRTISSIVDPTIFLTTLEAKNQT